MASPLPLIRIEECTALIVLSGEEWFVACWRQPMSTVTVRGGSTSRTLSAFTPMADERTSGCGCKHMEAELKLSCCRFCVPKKHSRNRVVERIE